ncbi:type VI secretion system Vgr family protein, partial [Cronobacter dublinensis]
TVAHYHFEENRYASGADSNTIHETRFEVIPADVPYRPAQKTPWPRTYGPQTAKVVGPQGESIWTDKYGRVKVKFHWDRLSKGDDTSSSWVRVSSAWAGQGFGGVQIPRVGDEVVVDFINGDPDRPLITGRVYNEASMPPWALPAAATQMGFLSRSKNGHKDNANALRFEDKAGHEQIWIHAERNMDTEIENSETHHVAVDRNKTIGRDEKNAIKRNMTTSVGVDSVNSIGSKHIVNVGKSACVLTMDKDGNTLLESTSSIKLKVGDNYLLISPQGINITVLQGDLTAESINSASLKGEQLTAIGGGVNVDTTAKNTVSITGVNLTDIKGAVVKINS